jgi:hypothetical protein
MEDFKNKEDISVMIASLKVGGTGLNLTMANKCILVEPWWNEAIAQQVGILKYPFLAGNILLTLRHHVGILPSISHWTAQGG